MKMSKSLGNVVDPYDIIKTFGSDSVRSYFLSGGPLFKDSNFELERLIEHHNNIICDAYCKIQILEL
jgi:methionyl-tRNA synthetase